MSSTEITLLTKNDGPLTKRLALREDGSVNADASACLMSRGQAQRLPIANVTQFAAAIGKLKNDQAIALGRLRPGLPDQVPIVTKDKLNGGASSGVIARTAGNLVYRKGDPAFALFDFDRKGMSSEIATNLEAIGGVWNALTSVLPELRTVARVTRASTSAGLRRADTGESLAGSGGLHVYVAVQDGEDVPRFLRALHERAWLAGFGWLMVGTGGQLLERSIVDRMVGAPERLVFEGGPILAPPLKQDRESRRPVAVDGTALDTALACPPLTIAEQAKLRELRAKAEHRLAPDAAKARADFITKQAKRLAERRGLSLPAAKEIVTRQCDGILLPDVELPFDDTALAGCTVADVLADPERFEGDTLADPLEGLDYGRGKAKIMRRRDGTPWINSFAHGHTVYELRLDAKSIRETMLKADRNEAASIFVKLALQADLAEDETESLRDLAADRAGIGRRTVARMLKKAQAKQADEHKREDRTRRLAERTDPRPLIEAPAPDAPWLPQMGTINSVLIAAPPERPQARDIDCDLISVSRLAIPVMHGFGAEGANAVESKNSLPNPEQWVIKKMDEMEAAEMIERHIDYVAGDDRSVHLLGPFVRHFMRRADGVLPTVAAVATLPIILPDGRLLMPEGLDRQRGIWFEIPAEVRAVMPEPWTCSDDAVRRAMLFLCEQWLVDVATDLTGKATIIAAALSILERCLLPDRPAFFVTAGRRGNGKTTALTMLIKAVTGISPAASAWSSNEEERRKALMSYLLYGVAYVLWDNIARGTQISCPHIEKSCTASLYSDRKLGVSEVVTAASSAIHLFTGNNIVPRGDLASRSLQIRLVVDRHDPENRNFKHPDPIGWTETHRAEILRALYVILMGNPMLKTPRNAAGKTRFKMWWRLVGSAVEHAARLVGQPVDFKKLFLDQEQDEEETTDLANALHALSNQWPTSFRANDVASLINTDQTNPHSTTLREFLFGKAAPGSTVSPKAVGKRLKSHLDAPVPYGDDSTLALRARRERSDQISYFVAIAPVSE